MCIVMTVCDITSVSAYIHSKCHLLLTSDWPRYEYCIGCARRNSRIITVAHSQYVPVQTPNDLYLLIIIYDNCNYEHVHFVFSLCSYP